MRMRLLNLYDAVLTSFWFIPGVMTLSMLALSVAFPLIDSYPGVEAIEKLSWVQISARSAQTILATIAGASVSIMGVVFSLTILTLSLVSSQLGPRLLRTFMADRTTHFALGLYLSTALYCLVVLTVVQEAEESGFVPRFSVLFAVLAAIISFTFLVYFIHRVAQLIQAPNIVAAVAGELDAALDRLYPEPLSDDPAPLPDVPPCPAENVRGRIRATKEGYLQGLDLDNLTACSQHLGGILWVQVRMGQYIAHDCVIVETTAALGQDEDMQSRVNDCFAVGSRRTPREDFECAISELTEVAVRALSPGVNDPYTALNCVDRLGGSLSRLATRQLPGPLHCDSSGAVRLVLREQTFRSALNEGFDQIRQYGRDSVTICIRLLEALITIGRAAGRSEYREAVLAQAEMIMGAVERNIPEKRDRADITERYEKLKQILQRADTA